MARDFTKNASNYMRFGTAAFAAVAGGASVLCFHAWVNLDTFSTSANNNRVLNTLQGSGISGIIFNIDKTGANAVVTMSARSKSTDALQTKKGTTGISTGVWTAVGGRVNFGAATIATFINGVKESEGSVTFGQSTFAAGSGQNAEDTIGSDCAVASPSTANQIDGRIAELTVWKGDITDSGFAALAKGMPSSRIRPNVIISYYRLDGNASPETDLSGNRKNATITGTISKANHAPISLRTKIVLASMPFASSVSTFTKTLTAQGLLKKLNTTKTINVQGILKKNDNTKTVTSQGLLQKTLTKTLGAQGLLKALNTLKTITSQALLKKTDNVETITGRGLLKKLDNLKTIAAQGLLASSAGGIITITAQGVLKKLGISKTVTAAGLIKKLNNTKTITAQGYLASSTTPVVATVKVRALRSTVKVQSLRNTLKTKILRHTVKSKELNPDG